MSETRVQVWWRGEESTEEWGFPNTGSDTERDAGERLRRGSNPGDGPMTGRLNSDRSLHTPGWEEKRRVVSRAPDGQPVRTKLVPHPQRRQIVVRWH